MSRFIKKIKAKDMKNRRIIYMVLGAFLTLSSCMDNLEQFPKEQSVATNSYETIAQIKSVLAYNYACVALPIATQAGYNNSYVGWRAYFNLNAIASDEAINSWGDSDKLNQIQYMQWTAVDDAIAGPYYDAYFRIANTNEFLRYVTDSKIAGFSADEQKTLNGYRYEIRFLRAWAYWQLLDFFGNVPLAVESDPVGRFAPPRATNVEMFAYIEKELKEVAENLPAKGANEYGRVSKGAAMALLARLYLNSEVYTGTKRYDDCVSYCDKVINEGYTLEPEYRKLFNAENQKRCENEIIFTIPGASNYMTNWSVNQTVTVGCAGLNALQIKYAPQLQGLVNDKGWGGWRARGEIVKLFPDIQTVDNRPTTLTEQENAEVLNGNLEPLTAVSKKDKRALFFSRGQSLDIADFKNKQQGYGVIKYTNLLDDLKTPAPQPNGGQVDTDMPAIRLAEIYLTYAEAVLRGAANGTKAKALDYVNLVRKRAEKQPGTLQIDEATLTLDFLLDERGREFYWECIRRTDLIRYDKFAGAKYIWSLKNGVPAGAATDKKYNLFPIPSTELMSNPNLIQNPGY